MKSVMQHTFQRIPRADIPRSVFDLSHGHKTTFNAGFLVPVFVEETIPGDTFHLNMSNYLRILSPLHVPVMDNLFLETFFFHVPMRLVWDNWEEFCGARKDPVNYDAPGYTERTIPLWNSNNGIATPHSIANYMGVPYTGDEAEYAEYSCLPLRAFWKIYNDWFRDQNLIDSIEIPLDDGPDDVSDYTLVCPRRAKKHDYFTSCLPWPQKGPSVTIPLGDAAPVWGNETPIEIHDGTGVRHLIQSTGTGIMQVTPPAPLYEDIGDVNTNVFDGGNKVIGFANNYDGAINALYADLSNATSSTINAFREAFQLQKMYERDARGGTRYVELVKSHYGVTAPMDARLQRAEYLGGGSQRINFSPVAQTTPQTQTAQGDALGTLGAFGTSAGSGHGFNKSFTEHGYVIGIINVRADLTYQRALHRMWNRRTRYDFYWPALAHLGEQTVLNKEIHFSPSDPDQDKAFGFQERYAEYRYKPSIITGILNSNAGPTSIDIYHLAQDFADQPLLNQSFIEDTPPMDRIKMFTSEEFAPDFVIDMYFAFKAVRPLPVYSVPGLIDHF